MIIDDSVVVVKKPKQLFSYEQIGGITIVELLVSDDPEVRQLAKELVQKLLVPSLHIAN